MDRTVQVWCDASVGHDDAAVAWCSLQDDGLWRVRSINVHMPLCAGVGSGASSTGELIGVMAALEDSVDAVPHDIPVLVWCDNRDVTQLLTTGARAASLDNDAAREAESRAREAIARRAGPTRVAWCRRMSSGGARLADIAASVARKHAQTQTRPEAHLTQKHNVRTKRIEATATPGRGLGWKHANPALFAGVSRFLHQTNRIDL